jgi:hypothetical protein
MWLADTLWLTVNQWFKVSIWLMVNFCVTVSTWWTDNQCLTVNVWLIVSWWLAVRLWPTVRLRPTVRLLPIIATNYGSKCSSSGKDNSNSSWTSLKKYILGYLLFSVISRELSSNPCVLFEKVFSFNHNNHIVTSIDVIPQCHIHNPLWRRHDTQHNDIQHNHTQCEGLICDF